MFKLRFQGVQCSFHAVKICFRSVVLPASKFQSILDVQTKTGATYSGAPLAHLSGKRRGDILSLLARNLISDATPNAVIGNPENGVCYNGVSRGVHRAEYDWKWNGRRLECKSSQLIWNSGESRWRFNFQGIKIRCDGVRSEGAFDDLVLALYTPERVYFYWHDLALGISSSGVLSACVGHSVTLSGPGQEHDWRLSLESILSKLDSKQNACARIADVPLDDERVNAVVLANSGSELVMKNVYESIPLSHLSGPVRGGRLQALVREVDACLHPDALFDDIIGGTCINGSSRSKRNGEYDWARNGRRIECKSSKLRWDAFSQTWRVFFQGIKLSSHGLPCKPAFDELLLAIYSPLGVNILRHDSTTAVSSAGIFTQARGHVISMYSSRAEIDYRDALKTMLSKFERRGCEPLAFIEWDSEIVRPGNLV